MARDYSSRRNSAPAGKNGRRGNSRPKPAAKSTQPRRTARSGPPGWVWMICGLCIGLMVAAGLYVFARPAGSPARDTVEIPTPPEQESADNDAPPTDSAAGEAEREDEQPRFSFYKMLPNYEVVIPEEEYPDPSTAAGERPAPTPEQAEASSPQPTTPKVKEPGRYIIQAGSFSTHADADRRKAELGLLGLAARIVEVDLDSGKTVYRVQSNPIDSSGTLNNMLKRLRENRIDTLVMRAKN